MALKYTKSSPYAGWRAIIWVRQSTKEQSETSCDDQANVIADFTEKQDIDIVDRVTLDGVSGSSPVVAEEIERLIQRKLSHDDFDLLVVHDLSRLTRGGAITGNHFQFTLAQAGITLLSAHDDNLGGDLGDIVSSFKHMASQHQAKAIALAVTRGRSASIERGDTPAIARPPFGIDRLIVCPDGQPSFILHLEPDGSQLKLDLNSRQVLGHYGRNGTRGAHQHYRKQDNETVALIVGDPADAATVREIFRLYDVEGWGYHRICRHLNETKVAAPTGGPWAKSSLRNLLMNPLYIGLAVSQTKVSGRYYARGGDKGGGPVKVERPLAETAGRRHLAHRPRPLSEWRLERLSQFQDFLPQPLRQSARRRIFKHLRTRASGKSGPQGRPRGKVDSQFILTNRLTARHNGEPLSGRNTGKTGNCRSYYSMTKARNRPGESNNELDRKLIPAPPLHALVISLLGDTIRSLPQLKQHLKEKAKAQQSASPAPAADGVDKLEAEHTDLTKQLNFLVENLEKFDLAVAERKMQDLTQRKDSIARQLSSSPSTRPKKALDMDKAIDKAVDELLKAENLVRELGRPMLDRLLDVLLAKAEVDMGTRYVEIEFRLPKWALEAPERICRGFSNVHRDEPKAHRLTAPEQGLLLYRGRFAWSKEGIMGILSA